MHAIQCYQKWKAQKSSKVFESFKHKKQIKSGLYWKKAQLEKNSEYVMYSSSLIITSMNNMDKETDFLR